MRIGIDIGIPITTQEELNAYLNYDFTSKPKPKPYWEIEEDYICGMKKPDITHLPPLSTESSLSLEENNDKLNHN